MAYNGSGTFVRLYSWITDAANGIFVSSTRMDADTNDIAAGLSTCITKDGQTTVTANIPMSGFKFTGLGIGSATTDAARVDNANAKTCEFRMSLTTGVPVTTADVTAAATVYLTPYVGNDIALYDGATWVMRTSVEMSIAVPAVATQAYDLFCYDNAGVPTLELTAWTNDTTRATALVYQNGVLCKTGALTRRYIGSIRTIAASQTEDSILNRFVWNYYNRVYRPMRRIETTAFWTYATATIRQANAAAANQVSFFVGVSEEPVQATLLVTASGTAGIEAVAGFGLDSTTVLATESLSAAGAAITAGNYLQLAASYNSFPGIGKHTLAWLEYASAATITFYGTSNARWRSGIHGAIWG